MSNTDRESVNGEVVSNFSLSKGQRVDKIYNNTKPVTMADEPGKYAIVRIGDE